MRFRSLLLLILMPATAIAADEGIPVQSELVQSACGSCHPSDDDGRMTRISYQRKAPEGWQLTLKRMIRTNGLNLTPDQARAIVRYLSDHHGLAPEEARPYFYRAEKRPQLENIEEGELKETCVRCHIGARFFTQRRTEEEWDLLKGMHIGYFPVIEFQTFRGASPLAGDAPAENTGSEWRADRVLETLKADYPLETPEWKRYKAKGTGRGIAGRWLLITHQPGEGPASGIVTFDKAGDDYTYSAEILLVDGSRHQREGKGVLYGGYSWRGSSNGDGLGELREVLMLSEDGSKLEGRIFSGTYGELGLDATLVRLGEDPRIAAVWPRSAKVGGGTASVTITGANFTDDILTDDLDFGQGVSVTDISSRTATTLTVTLEVSDDALSGYRDVALGPTQAVDAFAVYDRVDYVKVLPDEALARVGGGAVAKQFAKFAAAAFHRGPDDEPLTEDDVDLGTVQPKWSVKEYYIRHEDDDIEYVGTIDQKGLFTPAIDGPNIDRELNANNFGDVWVVASYRPDGASEILRGRSRLVVTIPIYVYWELLP